MIKEAGKWDILREEERKNWSVYGEEYPIGKKNWLIRTPSNEKRIQLRNLSDIPYRPNQHPRSRNDFVPRPLRELEQLSFLMLQMYRNDA
jgi:hypothetical protein